MNDNPESLLSSLFRQFPRHFAGRIDRGWVGRIGGSGWIDHQFKFLLISRYPTNKSSSNVQVLDDRGIKI